MIPLYVETNGMAFVWNSDGELFNINLFKSFITRL